MGARAANAVLGLWLFLSAFLWPHTFFHQTNAWIVGMAVVTLAMFGLTGVGWARYANAALGAWLILSAILVPRVGAATFWNHLLVGFALAMFGLASSIRDLRNQRPAHQV